MKMYTYIVCMFILIFPNVSIKLVVGIPGFLLWLCHKLVAGFFIFEKEVIELFSKFPSNFNFLFKCCFPLGEKKEIYLQLNGI